MSLLALLTMVVLFFNESLAFTRSSIETSITLDDSMVKQIKINFNVTFMDSHCDYLDVDVVDDLGTNRRDVTKNVEKWQLDDEGKKRIFNGRNREQRLLKDQDHAQTLEEMHENGVHVAVLDTKEHFQEFVKRNPMSFINFYAPWCIWCQRLHPTWEKFAEKVEAERLPVGVANVDCVSNNALCRELRIMAFPSLRWYTSGEPVQPDYKQDRTVDSIYGFAKRKIEMDERYKNWEGERKETLDSMRLGRPVHPGCQISGHLMVNRVPGNFHIITSSKNHNINPSMTNLTHTVNHLSFGENVNFSSRKYRRILNQVTDDHKQFSPIDDKTFLTKEFHQAYHHYIKVVSTKLHMGRRSSDKLTTYQFLEQNQIVKYTESDVPEARFAYDISPMSVVVSKEGIKWYDYLTSLCAIIGGTFTTLGLIDATLYSVLKVKKL